ncbi:MAG: hypothetical protein JOZ46_07545 [Candidatus Dormibacteraeota bacterium]|nr:hypothetical protein [Candidatus Dormibacteraeota bacterium]MBV9525652.1 hypothetical protein [Candidatus Dormibacteraeota bacterium]
MDHRLRRVDTIITVAVAGSALGPDDRDVLKRFRARNLVVDALGRAGDRRSS